MSLSIARGLFHFSGTSPTEPVPGNGPTIPRNGATDQQPQTIGWALPGDGLDLYAAKTTVVCEEGTHPVVKKDGNTVTVDCEPDKPKPAPKQGKPNIPILD
jgi:hypothetical protein